MRDIVPPAYVQVQRDGVSATAIAEAELLAAEANSLMARRDGAHYRLGSRFQDILSNGWMDDHEFNSWVRKSMVDRYGRPRKPEWARNLAMQFKVISEHTVLVQALERGYKKSGRDELEIISFSSAYYAAKTAELERWELGLRAEYDRAAGPPETAEEMDKKKRWVDLHVSARLVELARKPSNQLKGELEAKREELGIKRLNPTGEGVPPLWPFIGGYMDPDTKGRWDAVVDYCYKITGEPRKAGDSFMKVTERVITFLEDVVEKLQTKHRDDANDKETHNND